MHKMLFLVTIICTTTLLADDGFRFHVKAGVTRGGLKDHSDNKSMDSLYTYNGDPVPAKCRIMPSFEIGYEYEVSKIFSAAAGLGIKFVGNQFVADGSSGTLNDSLKMTVLTIPIDFKVTLPTKIGGVFLAARPQANFFASADFAGVNYKEELAATFDVSLGFRLGGEIEIAQYAIILESGFDWGLADIFEDITAPNSHTGTATAKACTITLLAVGFRFNLPKNH